MDIMPQKQAAKSESEEIKTGLNWPSNFVALIELQTENRWHFEEMGRRGMKWGDSIVP